MITKQLSDLLANYKAMRMNILFTHWKIDPNHAREQKTVLWHFLCVFAENESNVLKTASFNERYRKERYRIMGEQRCKSIKFLK